MVNRCFHSRSFWAITSIAAVSAGLVYGVGGSGIQVANAGKTCTQPAQSSPPGPTCLLAQQSRVIRVQFAPGKDSKTIDNAVVRGTRDIYLLGAKQGQMFTAKISSVENNAVFDVMAPANKAGQRRPLKEGVVSWSGKLPQDGDYQIVVGATRGNATYKLQVGIR